MNWLNKLKEYAPSIAGAILSGGATLPQLALKAISDATGVNVLNETDLADMVESASPEVMLKLKQANNSFKIRMRELNNELVSANWISTVSYWVGTTRSSADKNKLK